MGRYSSFWKYRLKEARKFPLLFLALFYKNRIIADYFNITPVDSYIFRFTHKTEKALLAADDKCRDTTRAGVEFNITYRADISSVFNTDYVFIAQTVYWTFQKNHLT